MLHCLRPLLLRANYWLYKLKNRHVTFHGYTVIMAFPGSQINLGKGVINSSFESNNIGLWQRCGIIAKNGGRIEIGDNFGISGSTIYSIASITIGKNFLLGGNCKIIDNDFHPINPEARRIGKSGDEQINKAPIIIGDDCFIGMNSIILKGTILGNNVVVGAGSVVHGTFPDNCLIAGNPAKIIRRTNEN